MNATDDLVLRSDRDGIATLTLNRPQKRNALNAQSFEQLRAHIDALTTQTQSIGCVILTASGPSFSAGADLDMLATSAANPEARAFRAATIDALAALPQPVIAAVRGHCYTGGLELAIAADFIVASETARFADTHAKLGGTPRWGQSVRLPRRIGIAAAKDLLLTSRVVDGTEALHIGLVDRCVADADLETQAEAFAKAILANNWRAVRAAKQLLNHQQDLDEAAALQYERNFAME